MFTSLLEILRVTSHKSSKLVSRNNLAINKSFLDRSSERPFISAEFTLRRQTRNYSTSSADQQQRRSRTNSVKRRSIMIQPTELNPKYNMEWPKITLFGDSITRRSFDPNFGCWGSHIAHMVGNYFDVDFRGFEGYNSKWSLQLAPKLFPKHYLERVEIFVLFYGHNDSFDSSLPLHVPVKDYEVNMRKIVDYLLANGLTKEKIILLTPTWYDFEGVKKAPEFQNLPPFFKDIAEQEKYSDAIKRLGQDYGITVVDFFSISSKHEKLDELFCDGVHLSQAGAKLLFDAIKPVIEAKIESSFKKPLADLWHTVPIDQHPEVKPVLDAYRAATADKK